MNYYRKTVDNVVDNVKLKMQMAAFTLKLSENKNNISSNLSKINTNTSDISSNLTKINAIDKVSDEVFNDRYDIINQSFNFNKNTHSYQLFEKTMKISTGELIMNTIINYKYNNLENDINRLTHLYQFYDDKDNLFYSITLDNHDFGVPSDLDKNILNINDNFCFNIDNKNNIKLVLTLTRINQWGDGNINLQMIDNNSINIIYNKKTDISNKFNENDKKINTNTSDISDNTSLIDTNKNNISDNLSKINTNTSDISDNTSLIDTNKNNISDNLSTINTNTSDISNNFNFTQINKKKSDNNVTLIDTNRNNINSNLNTLNNIDNDLISLRSRINDHQTDIQTIDTNINELHNNYNITDILIFNVTSNINDVIDSSKPKFVVFEKDIIYNFLKDSYFIIDISILSYFKNHYINIQFFYLLLECIDQNDTLFKELKINIIGTISKHGVVVNSSIINIPYDMTSLKIKISINLQNGQNRSEIVKISNFDNHVYLKILEK